MLQVKLVGLDYEAAVFASTNMACSRKSGGKFEHGCVNTEKEPTKAERTGRLGEVAIARYLGVEPDLEPYEKGGDTKDFDWAGLSIDVKTSTSFNPDLWWIRAITEWGRYCPLTCDVYLFAWIAKEDKEKKIAWVNYEGFLYNKEVLRAPLPSRQKGSKHSNFEIWKAELRPMEDFLDEERLTLPWREKSSGQASTELFTLRT